MSELRTIDLQDIVSRAAAALSRVRGKAIRLSDVQVLSGARRRNHIARATAVDDDGNSERVIVKTTRAPAYDLAADDALATSGLVREWVATSLLSARAPGRGHGGALLAADAATGTLVLEDLGSGAGSLVDPLLKGTAEDAERALRLYATALARLHTDTANCLEPYHRAYEAIVGADRPRRPPGWRVESDAAVVADLLGHAPPASELESLSSRLRDPGPWLSLAHGDPCPDNALLVDGRIALIDYEWARPSHALLDGIYWRIGFPTCWCAGRVPSEIAGRIEAAYRDELARSVPLARDDDAYRIEAACMSAVWLFTSLSWRLAAALQADETWGIWSIRGRLLWYLEAVIEAADDARVLPGISDSARLWLAALRRRWPEAMPLGLYPAFAATATIGPIGN